MRPATDKIGMRGISPQPGLIRRGQKECPRFGGHPGKEGILPLSELPAGEGGIRFWPMTGANNGGVTHTFNLPSSKS